MNTSKLTKISNQLFVLFGLTGLIYLMLLFVSVYALGFLYNSDIVSIPYLYLDLFVHHGSLSQWTFPPTPCFFPDALVYFLLVALAAGNFKLGIVLFAVFQYLMYFCLIILVGKKASQNKSYPSIFILSALLTFFLYAAGTLQQNIFYATTMGGHFGAALMFLVCLWLILHSFSHKGYWPYVALGVICLLTSFSDLLFLTQFVATALISITIFGFLVRFPTKTYLTYVGVIAISALLGYFCFAKAKLLFGLHLVHDGKLIKRHNLHDLLAATKMIFTKLSMFYQNNAIIVLGVVVFFCITFVYFSKLIYRYWGGAIIKKEDQPFIFTIIILFVSIIVGYFSLILLDNNLMSNDPSLRHFQPFVLFSVFLGLPLYLAKYTQLEVLLTKYIKAIIVAMLLCGFTFAPKGSIANLVNYYPNTVACLDRFAPEYHLQNGIGQYWDAKLMSVLSKQGVNIVAVRSYQGKIVPSIWDNTLNAYLHKDFNFVIIDTPQNDIVNQVLAVNTYGKPEKILQCPSLNQSSILIYLYPTGIINSTWNKTELKV